MWRGRGNVQFNGEIRSYYGVTVKGCREMVVVLYISVG